jgi:hypothetical protein
MLEGRGSWQKCYMRSILLNNSRIARMVVNIKAATTVAADICQLLHPIKREPDEENGHDKFGNTLS